MEDASHPAPDQLPLGALIRIAMRFLPVIVAGALVAGVAAYFLLDNSAKTPEGTVTLGLTEAVRWPFYEPVRGRLASAVDEALVTEVRDQLGNGTIEIAAVIPDALAVVDIKATANSNGDALAAADLAADLVLVSVEGSRKLELQAMIDASRAEIAIIRTSVDAAEERLDELFVSRAAAQDDVSARRIEDDISTTTRERNSDLQSILDLESDIDALDVELLALQPEASVVARTLSSETSSTRRLTLAGAAALSVAIFATLAAMILSSDRGSVRSAQHLAVASEYPVREWGAGNPAGLVRWLTQRTNSSARVGVIGADGEAWAWQLTRSIEVLVPSDHLPVFADIGPRSELEQLLHCDSAVVVVPEGTSLTKVRDRLAWLQDSEIPVAGLLYHQRGGAQHAEAS